MILPLGDSPNPRGLPVVNTVLVAVNILVFLVITWPLSTVAPDPNDPAVLSYVQYLSELFGEGPALRQALASVTAYDVFVWEHGFRPAAPSVEDLFVSLFLHAGFAHLAGNMLFLWIYGDNVEDRLGRLGYLAAYLGCGVAATLAHAAFDLDSQTPMVGASGAISGAMGFYFLFFPRNTVRLFVVFFPFLVDVVVVSARLVLGLYLLVDNLLPFLFTRWTEGGGVAHGAHIGGFVAGIGAAWLVDRREERARPGSFRPRERPAPAERPSSSHLAELVRAGRVSEAARLYFAGDERSALALPPDEGLELARWLVREGQPEAALSVYRRVLRRHPVGPAAAAAHLGAGLVQLHALGRPTSAYQHFLDVLDLEPDGEAAERARRGLEEVRVHLSSPRFRGRREG